MGATAKRSTAVIYPESDNVGEHELQRFIAELLRPLVARWLSEQSREGHTGADQFFYLYEGDPKRYRAPDVYVISDLSQDIAEVGSWKIWEGHIPHLAIEICGDDWQKDYDEAPADYAEMGTQELVIFDPGANARSRRRVRWQVYRRNAAGAFRKAQASSKDRVRSVFLGCFLRAVDERGHLRLRRWYGRSRRDALSNRGRSPAHRPRDRAPRQRGRTRRQRGRTRCQGGRARRGRGVEEGPRRTHPRGEVSTAPVGSRTEGSGITARITARSANAPCRYTPGSHIGTPIPSGTR